MKEHTWQLNLADDLITLARRTEDEVESATLRDAAEAIRLLVNKISILNTIHRVGLRQAYERRVEIEKGLR